MKQISKLLIAYDGSECSNAAVYDLRRAGLPMSVEVVLLTVADVILPPPDDELPDVPAIRIPEVERRAQLHGQEAIKKARNLAEHGARLVKTNFAGWDVRTEVECDSPAWSVIQMADRLGTDLIVLGSRGHLSAGGRLILGNVSQRVLYEAGCSVRVARCPEKRRQGPVRIVVGFNGSYDSNVAVTAVASRAWPEGSEARVITAHETSKPEAHIEATEKLRAVGLTTTEVSKKGDAAHALIEEAEEWDADAIFVGTRDLHGFHHLLHGSVSSAVAARALCSVEVVRPMARTQPD